MKASKMQGLLCRSQSSTSVCRSYASTAVCAPADMKAAVIAPPRRSYDVRYSRLRDGRRLSTGGDRIQAVTLSMVTKRERAPQRPKPKPTLCSGAHATASSAAAAPPPPPPVTSTRDQLFQVVVMRVSIHCQGCAGKLRKHISKMEGVTSFSIDLESKRVTVMGHVSPAGVLQSISKIKKAEFWTCS